MFYATRARIKEAGRMNHLKPSAADNVGRKNCESHDSRVHTRMCMADELGRYDALVRDLV